MVDAGAWTVRSEALPLGDVLVRSALRHPDSVALAFPDEQYTFWELLDRSIEVARGLYALGVRAGDHVGALAPNCIEYVTALFGSALLGAVFVPLNARSTGRELDYLVRHARLTVLLTTDRIDPITNFRSRLDEALPGLAESDPRVDLKIESAPALRRIVMLRGGSGGGCLGADEFIALTSSVPESIIATLRARVRVRDTAYIIYTSGTTSNPKGCMLSHEAVTRGPMARNPVAYRMDHEAEPIVMWATSPLYHIASLQGFVYTVAVGATYVTDVHLDAERAWAQIMQWRPNQLWALFIQPLRVLRTAREFDPAKLDFVTAFAAFGPTSELMEWQDMLPHALLVNGSGMSETNGWFCLSDPDDTPLERASTAGKLVSGAQARIVDPETLDDLPDGRKGLLLVKTYTMMDGYFGDPEKTSETIDVDGWLHTGDIFTKHPTGHFVYEGRLKDMLKVGGENVPTVEVETYLCSHPAVLVAEVVGVPDLQLDEVPVAFVELSEGSAATEAEIIDFCRGSLASFKVPRAVHFKQSDEWPRSSTKISKIALRIEAVAFAAVSS